MSYTKKESVQSFVYLAILLYDKLVMEFDHERFIAGLEL